MTEEPIANEPITSEPIANEQVTKENVFAKKNNILKYIKENLLRTDENTGKIVPKVKDNADLRSIDSKKKIVSDEEIARYEAAVSRLSSLTDEKEIEENLNTIANTLDTFDISRLPNDLFIFKKYAQIAVMIMKSEARVKQVGERLWVNNTDFLAMQNAHDGSKEINEIVNDTLRAAMNVYAEIESFLNGNPALKGRINPQAYGILSGIVRLGMNMAEDGMAVAGKKKVTDSEKKRYIEYLYQYRKMDQDRMMRYVYSLGRNGFEDYLDEKDDKMTKLLKSLADSVLAAIERAGQLDYQLIDKVLNNEKYLQPCEDVDEFGKNNKETILGSLFERRKDGSVEARFNFEKYKEYAKTPEDTLFIDAIMKDYKQLEEFYKDDSKLANVPEILDSVLENLADNVDEFLKRTRLPADNKLVVMCDELDNVLNGGRIFNKTSIMVTDKLFDVRKSLTLFNDDSDKIFDEYRKRKEAVEALKNQTSELGRMEENEGVDYKKQEELLEQLLEKCNSTRKDLENKGKEIRSTADKQYFAVYEQLERFVPQMTEIFGKYDKKIDNLSSPFSSKMNGIQKFRSALNTIGSLSEKMHSKDGLTEEDRETVVYSTTLILNGAAECMNEIESSFSGHKKQKLNLVKKIKDFSEMSIKILADVETLVTSCDKSVDVIKSRSSQLMNFSQFEKEEHLEDKENGLENRERRLSFGLKSEEKEIKPKTMERGRSF